MNSSEFEDYLDRFGSDLTVWPAMLGEEARQLLKSDETVQAVYQAALDMDELLADTMQVSVPLGLRTRVLAQVENAPKRTLLDQWLQFMWKPIVAGVLPLVVGFSLGVVEPDNLTEIENSLADVTFVEYSIDNGGDYEP